MKKLNPVIKAKDFAAQQSIRISEGTISKKEKVKDFLAGIAEFFIFLWQVIREIFSPGFEFKEFLRQCFQIGNKSLSLITVTGFIVGLVLTIQSRPALVQFGAVKMLPGIVAVSLIREMGPAITALICAGKIGSGIGAELGSMKVTEQIEAMEVSATNPMKFLVVTRVLACTLMIPLLVLYDDAVGLIGSWLGANIKGDINFVLFFNQAFSGINFMDFLPAVVKTFLFGAIIGLIGCFKGYRAGTGTESVGVAANSAVVLSSLLVIVVDMIAVQITDMITNGQQ